MINKKFDESYKISNKIKEIDNNIWDLDLQFFYLDNKNNVKEADNIMKLIVKTIHSLNYVEENILLYLFSFVLTESQVKRTLKTLVKSNILKLEGKYYILTYNTLKNHIYKDTRKTFTCVKIPNHINTLNSNNLLHLKICDYVLGNIIKGLAKVFNDLNNTERLKYLYKAYFKNIFILKYKNMDNKTKKEFLLNNNFTHKEADTFIKRIINNNAIDCLYNKVGDRIVDIVEDYIIEVDDFIDIFHKTKSNQTRFYYLYSLIENINCLNIIEESLKGVLIKDNYPFQTHNLVKRNNIDMLNTLQVYINTICKANKYNNENNDFIKKELKMIELLEKMNFYNGLNTRFKRTKAELDRKMNIGNITGNEVVKLNETIDDINKIDNTINKYKEQYNKLKQDKLFADNKRSDNLDVNNYPAITLNSLQKNNIFIEDLKIIKDNFGKLKLIVSVADLNIGTENNHPHNIKRRLFSTTQYFGSFAYKHANFVEVIYNVYYTDRDKSNIKINRDKYSQVLNENTSYTKPKTINFIKLNDYKKITDTNNEIYNKIKTNKTDDIGDEVGDNSNGDEAIDTI